MGLGSFVQYITSEKRYSKHTVKAYTHDLEQFFQFTDQQYNTTQIENIDHYMIRSWIVEMIEQGLMHRSVNRKLSTLKTYYKFLLKEGKIENNPFNKIISPKTESRLPVFIEKEKLNILLDEKFNKDSYEGNRDRAIIELLYGTGIRLSELVNLQEKDFDITNSTIKVVGKRNKERIVPLNIQLKQTLVEYKKMKKRDIEGPDIDRFLFTTAQGKKIYNKLVYRIVNKYLSQVTTLNKKSPHVLRHTFATHLLNEGADLNAIKEILGHASLAATQVYTHNTIGQLKSIHQKSHPREKTK